MRCGVVGAAEEDQAEWFQATMQYMTERYPELSEQQICKLLGTTKTTVQAVRDRTHWKSQDIRPRDPVFLGLCSQTELDEAVARARAEQPKDETERRGGGAGGGQPPAGVEAGAEI